MVVPSAQAIAIAISGRGGWSWMKIKLLPFILFVNLGAHTCNRIRTYFLNCKAPFVFKLHESVTNELLWHSCTCRIAFYCDYFKIKEFVHIILILWGLYDLVFSLCPWEEFFEGYTGWYICGSGIWTYMRLFSLIA